jgi:hypothetical protein
MVGIIPLSSDTSPVVEELALGELAYVLPELKDPEGDQEKGTDQSQSTHKGWSQPVPAAVNPSGAPWNNRNNNLASNQVISGDAASRWRN